MTDVECVDFLRWALPQMGLRWEGFRKVRRQVCRRITRRIAVLGLENQTEYRALLERQPSEWEALDHCCRITISRFCRDRGVFEVLGQSVLPALALAEIAEGGEVLRCWSVGCASGEEAYSLVMLWQFEVAERFPDLAFEVLATDVDSAVLERAARACYGPSSIKDVPADWLEHGFDRRNGLFCVWPRFKRSVTFVNADVRRTRPRDSFQLVLCRNLVFTYFAPEAQGEVLEMFGQVLGPGGVLVVGSHESLPRDTESFELWQRAERIYRRRVATG